MVNIYIEDLVANSFITYLINKDFTSSTHELSLAKIEKLGKQIVENLKRKNIRAKLHLSRDLTEEFFRKYKDWFSLKGTDIVVLNEFISMDDLIDEFSGYLSIDLLNEFDKEKNYRILYEKD